MLINAFSTLLCYNNPGQQNYHNYNRFLYNLIVLISADVVMLATSGASLQKQW